MKWLFPLLMLIACQDESIARYSDTNVIWRLTELHGEPFAGTITLQIASGKISGSAPCNRYFAQQNAAYPWFKAGPIGATKRACPDLQTEARYFAALKQAHLAEVTNNMLLLSGEDGAALLTFRPED